MAKAKRAAPTRPCVNKDCGKPIHPRAKECPYCHTAQPQSTKAKSVRKSVAALPPSLQPTVSEFMRDMSKVVDKYGAETVANFAKMIG